MDQFKTREEWLIAAVEALRPLFAEHDYEIPGYKVSVGWPGGRGKKAGTIGQCWNSKQTEDGTVAIFVSPVVKSPVEALQVLVHELIHAVDDCQSGHRGEFARMFKALGMAGKKTACGVGDELLAKLQGIAGELGRYPHSQMKGDNRDGQAEKKQKTYMLKIEAACCGYLVRTTQAWIDQGLPSCPCGNEMELAS